MLMNLGSPLGRKEEGREGRQKHLFPAGYYSHYGGEGEQHCHSNIQSALCTEEYKLIKEYFVTLVFLKLL